MARAHSSTEQDEKILLVDGKTDEVKQ